MIAEKGQCCEPHVGLGLVAAERVEGTAMASHGRYEPIIVTRSFAGQSKDGSEALRALEIKPLFPDAEKIISGPQ